MLFVLAIAGPAVQPGQPVAPRDLLRASIHVLAGAKSTRQPKHFAKTHSQKTQPPQFGRAEWAKQFHNQPVNQFVDQITLRGRGW